MKHLNKLIRTVMAFAAAIWICGLSVCSAAGIREAVRSLSDTEEPFGIVIHAEMIKLPPYSEERTEKLNRLLKHMDLQILTDHSLSRSSLLLDGETLFSWTEEEKEGTDGIQNESVRRYQQLWESLYAGAEWFEKLPEQLPEKTVFSAISVKYKAYGTAVRKAVITLDADEMAEYMAGTAERTAGTGIYPSIWGAVFQGRQKITLQFSEDGRIVRAYYNGRCGLTEESFRNVALDWKILRTENMEKDELQIRTPAGSSSERDNLLLDRTWERQEDGSEQLTWKAETDRMANRIRTQIRMDASLLQQDGKITGTVRETATSQGETVSTEIRAEMETQDDALSSGTLEIISKKGKIETEHYRVLFRTIPGEKLSAPGLSPDDTGTREEEQRHQAAVLLQALMKLPEEDLAFLKDGIEEELWASVEQILGK